MGKCDFCVKSKPNGGCLYSTQAMREKHCKNAIDLMVKTLGGGEKIQFESNKKG